MTRSKHSKRAGTFFSNWQTLQKTTKRDTEPGRRAKHGRARTIALSILTAVIALAQGFATPALAQQQTQTFTTPGAHTFVVPQGVTSIDIEATGPGGGGGQIGLLVVVPAVPAAAR